MPNRRFAITLATVKLTDESLVQRILAGETALFELIMRRYNQRLYRLVRSILIDPHESEDALQEAYVRAYQHLGQFAGRARLSTWLSRIAVNEARARIRRRQRIVSAGRQGIALEEMAGRDAPPDREMCSAELREAIAQALEALPCPLRMVFVLREVEGLGTAETAESLGITPANVKVRLHRAREQLRAALEPSIASEAASLYAFDGERCDRIVAGVMHRITGSLKG